MEHDVASCGQLGDRVRIESLDRQRAVALSSHGGAGLVEHAEQLGVLGASNPHEATWTCGYHLGHRGLRDQAPLPDHDQGPGGERYLADQVAGNEHCAALGGQARQKVAHPDDPVRVEAIDRLVHFRIAQQGGSDPEPLAHAEGERACPLVGDRREPHQVEDFLDPGPRYVMGLGECEQMMKAAAPRMKCLGLEQRAHLPQRPRQLGVATAIYRGPPSVGIIQTQDQAHCG